jgi:DNA-binding response OmpR family regulator
MHEKQPEPKALVMVVDDNPDFLSGVELTLQMEGFAVWLALDGQQALHELKEFIAGSSPHESLPDVILADIMMPVMDGYTFYDQVRANPYLNHIPFIFLTAKTGEADVRQGKELGADDYLTKPCAAEDLLASIQGKLRRAQQRRNLTAEFLGEPTEVAGSQVMIALILIGGLIFLAFCLGILLPISWG